VAIRRTQPFGYGSEVVGIGLAAGEGRRSRPLTLKAKGYLRSKGAVRLLGQRLMDWVIKALVAEGIHHFIMVTKGKENRYQVKRLLGYGEGLDILVRYSQSRFDKLDRGSADATLLNLEQFDVQVPAFVMPTDSILEVDMRSLLDQHQSLGSITTVLTFEVDIQEAVDKYGVLVTDPDGRVTQFVEKPSAEEAARLVAQLGTSRVLTNAGFYLLDSAACREQARDSEIRRMRERSLDFGKDFLPWLVQRGLPVHTRPIGKVGDLGNIPSYVETMLRVLRGDFAHADQHLGHVYDRERRIWIEPESLHMVDEWSGRTLQERIESGDVKIGECVRIGKYVQIYSGTELSHCNIDDECEVYEGARIVRSSIGEGSMIGPHAEISDCVCGVMCSVQSSRSAPTLLSGHTAIGDEAILRAGVMLEDGVMVYPRVKVPRGCYCPPGTELTSADDVLEWL
jgi:NDP-sugar pyrophosphorylase family protein